MEFEINFSEVLQFLSVEKYKKLIYKHGTSGMNQSLHRWSLMNNVLMGNDKEPPVVTEMLGLASKERAGKRLFLHVYSKVRQGQHTCNPVSRRLFSCKCENCWGRQQIAPNSLAQGHRGTPPSSTGEPELLFCRVESRSEMKHVFLTLS